MLKSMKSLSAFSPLPMDISHGKLVSCIGVRAPLDLGGGGGGGDLISRKKLHNARKHVSVYKRTQTAVKKKRSHF